MHIKTLLTILILVLLSHSSHAQIKKGNIYIDPTFTISHKPTPWNPRTGFALEFDIGFFATDRLMLGFGLSSELDTETNDATTAGIRSLVRYYYWQKERHGLFLHNAFSYQANTFSTLLGLGWNLRLNPSISLESVLSYEHANPKFGDNYDRTRLAVGLAFFLNKPLRDQYESWPSPLSQGNWMIGGSTAIFDKVSAQSEIGVHPSIGYFLSDRIAVGAKLSYARFRAGNNFPIQLTIWEATPFFRFFVTPKQVPVFAFVGASVGHYAQSFLGDDMPETAIQAAAELGFGVMVSPYVAFDMRLAYQSIGRLAENRQWDFDFGFQYFLTP
ncbi:MAG: hypothetical protein KTR30_09860 [Saprospiraceae bacterium]|nr:hypothetical protein [Saprospiraceae bacterium]